MSTLAPASAGHAVRLGVPRAIRDGKAEQDRQAAVAATLFQREPGGPWIASAHTGGALALPGLEITLPLAELYQGSRFPA